MWSRSRYTRAGSFRQRIGIVLRWPIGLFLITWRYLWRVTPVTLLGVGLLSGLCLTPWGSRGGVPRVTPRDEVGGPQDLPPPFPDGADRDDVQGVPDGYGPLLHRRYAVRVEGARVGPEQAIRQLAADPNSAAPEDAAVFVKSGDEGDDMAVGDEYIVRMPGPWDGPVRVVHRTPTSFRFATLRGHLEAGEIEFRARCEGDELVFEIESWARPGDRVSHLLYNKLLLAKEIQLNLWSETCLGVVRNSGGTLRGGVRVHTRRVEDPLAGAPSGRAASA